MYQYPYGNAQQLNLDWILNKLKELEIGSGATLEEVSNALIALNYAEQNYNLSDIVFYDGKLYSANQNITAESWNPDHWNEVLLANPVSNLVRYVSALNNGQVFNTSNVAGTHTSDALNNLASDISDLNDNKITIYSKYYGDTDLDSIVAHGLEIYTSEPASLQNKPFTFTTLHPPDGQTGYFGNSSVTCICKFSSANYGYGLLLSGSNKFLAAFRRDNAINYLYPIGDFQTEINNLNGAINNVQGQITAYVQTSATATRNYKVGDYLVYNNTLYRVANAITSGTSIISKISATTIGNEIGLTTYNASDVVTNNVDVEIYKSGHFVEINCYVNTATGVSLGTAWQDLMTIPSEIAPKLQTRFPIINYLDGNIYQARLINGTGKLQVYMPSAGTFLPTFTFVYLVE